MTKYEWETELKRNIHSLPADEVKRVLEYYGELFDEMAERGKSEREIINEFGNPFDVANKILSEYDGEPEANSVGVQPSAIDAGAAEHAVKAQCQQATEPQREAERSQDDMLTPESAAKNAAGQKAESGRRLDTSRVALFILLNVFTGGVMFIIIGAIWIILAALVIVGAALVLGGGVAAISSFAVMSTGHAGAGGAQLGISIAAAGFGMLLAVGCVMLIIRYGKRNMLIFGGIKKFLTVKAV